MKKEIISVIVLIGAIVFMLSHISVNEKRWQAETNSPVSITQYDYNHKRTGKAVIKGMANQEYILCNPKWGDLYIEVADAKGKAVFRNIPEGPYRIKRKEKNGYKRLYCTAYVMKDSVITVLDR